jgi:T5orf172 domain
VSTAAFETWRFQREQAQARYFASMPVYFIQHGPPDGLIKIGFSADIRSRIKSIQLLAPLPLRLLGHVPGGMEKESELHARFETSRHHGEWFSPTPDLLAWVEAHAATGMPEPTVKPVELSESFAAWSLRRAAS